jgi:guanylate kinase
MDLEQMTKGYQPTPETVELVQNSKITLLVGISGAGKDTIKHKLLEKEGYRDIVSHTTREPRKNNGVMEVNGEDYHFISNETARTMLARQAFIEAKFVHHTLYGTSANEVQLAHDADKIAVTDIDVQGVDEYKELSRDVVAIFILPPSYAVWRERLQQRYETSEAFEVEWPKRRESAIMELEKALFVPYYHFIINDDLDRSVRVVDEIAQQGDLFNRKDDEARLLARDILDEIREHS